MNKNNLSDVSTNSKKITKRTKNARLVPKEATPPPKKYQTTKKDEKFELLAKIRRIADPELLDENWNQTVIKYKPARYRGLLNQLFPNLKDPEIRPKWKNMKRMLENIKKSDGRGGALLANDEEKKEFKRHVAYVIKHKMKTRSFEQLRKHVLPKIFEIFANSGRPFPDEPFQKHFWSYYHKAPENIDIKAMWKKLPRTKPQNFLKDNDFSFISAMLEGNDENTSSLYEEDETNIEVKILIKEATNDNVYVELENVEEYGNFEEERVDNSLEKFIPVEDFLNKNSFSEDEGSLSEKGDLFEASYPDFDKDIMAYFDKSICN